MNSGRVTNPKVFRARLLVGMTLLVVTISLLGLSVIQGKVADETEHDLQRDFEMALASLHNLQQVRRVALAERCRALVRRPRIHAALEDNALDLLYPSARDELRDLMDGEVDGDPQGHVLRARFYRFLDRTGAVIPPPVPEEVGALTVAEESQLTLPALPQRQQLGYLSHPESGDVDEVIAMPIFSSETGELIAAIVVGFKPAALSDARGTMRAGLWLDRRLHLPSIPDAERADVAGEVSRRLDGSTPLKSAQVDVAGVRHLLLLQRLNEDSLFPPAYEVCLYPLDGLLQRQQNLRWQAAAMCAALLLGGVVASHFLAVRFTVPVERLAVDSAVNRAQRQRAEEALEITSEELQRSARFSADTSHQLKTPVTVLRAGLEELLAAEDLPDDMRDDLSSLVHQTFRLTGIIEDLLLLSRMDAGRLEIAFAPVNLNRLIEAWLDDLSAIPEGYDVEVELDLPEAFEIAGEKRFTTLIVENLLVNARKYNRPGGQIKIRGDEDGEWAVLRIANTGARIPPEAQESIFERFHRGAMGENIPGHGLGLNLARELARLHHGELRLVRSEGGWTEFEVRFRIARYVAKAALQVA